MAMRPFGSPRLPSMQQGRPASVPQAGGPQPLNSPGSLGNVHPYAGAAMHRAQQGPMMHPGTPGPHLRPGQPPAQVHPGYGQQVPAQPQVPPHSHGPNGDLYDPAQQGPPNQQPYNGGGGQGQNPGNPWGPAPINPNINPGGGMGGQPLNDPAAGGPNQQPYNQPGLYDPGQNPQGPGVGNPQNWPGPGHGTDPWPLPGQQPLNDPAAGGPPNQQPYNQPGLYDPGQNPLPPWGVGNPPLNDPGQNPLPPWGVGNPPLYDPAQQGPPDQQPYTAQNPYGSPMPPQGGPGQGQGYPQNVPGQGYPGAAGGGSVNSQGGLPLDPQFEAQRRQLEDALSQELAASGVQQQQIPAVLQQLVARLQSQQGVDTQNLAAADAGRGLFDSGVHLQGQSLLDQGYDLQRQDATQQALQQLQQLQNGDAGAYQDYNQGLVEAMLGQAHTDATTRGAPVSSVPGAGDRFGGDGTGNDGYSLTGQWLGSGISPEEQLQLQRSRQWNRQMEQKTNNRIARRKADRAEAHPNSPAAKSLRRQGQAAQSGRRKSQSTVTRGGNPPRNAANSPSAKAGGRRKGK